MDFFFHSRSIITYLNRLYLYFYRFLYTYIYVLLRDKSLLNCVVVRDEKVLHILYILLFEFQTATLIVLLVGTLQTIIFCCLLTA